MTTETPNTNIVPIKSVKQGVVTPNQVAPKSNVANHAPTSPDERHHAASSGSQTLILKDATQPASITLPE